jgi:hypothetical protein
MSAEKIKRGPRLGKPSVLKQTSALMIRITDAQRRLFEERAAIHGLSASAWARMILLRQVRVEVKEEGSEK